MFAPGMAAVEPCCPLADASLISYRGQFAVAGLRPPLRLHAELLVVVRKTTEFDPPLAA